MSQHPIVRCSRPNHFCSAATYEGFSAAWPELDGEFAYKMNSMPKSVVSSTLTYPEWNNTTVLSGDVIEEIRKLKAHDGGPLLVAGSAIRSNKGRMRSGRGGLSS